MKEQILPATLYDYAKLYVHLPRLSLRLFKVVEEGKTLALFGYYYSDKNAVAFCRLAGKFPAKKIYRVALRCFDKLKECDLPLLAVADKRQPCAENFLSHLGFEFALTCHEGDVYSWTSRRV